MSKRQQTTLFMTLDDLVAADHSYRKLDALLSFEELANRLKAAKKKEWPLACAPWFCNSWKIVVIVKWRVFCEWDFFCERIFFCKSALLENGFANWLGREDSGSQLLW